MKNKIIAVAILISICGGYWFTVDYLAKKKAQEYDLLISEVSSRVLNDEQFTNFRYNNEDVNVKFHYNKKLEKYIKRQMSLYASKAMAIVVMDNDTGEVLSLLSYNRATKMFGRSLAVLASHPSASLTKIVTAAELLENAGYNPKTNIITRGKGTTLYKYQLKEEHRWNRRISLEKAFAYSNNAAFGKAAIENSSAISLYKMAMSFGFNKSISSFLDLPRSIFRMPTSQFNLAELASGFNKETMISPLHAAVFASIVANEGKLVRPRLLKSLEYKGEDLLSETENMPKEKVLSRETASQLATLMRKTVEFGTARKSFRRFRRKLKRQLEIGGKTGSITGGYPEGKRDWFSAYSKPKDSSNKGISISVMSIQSDKWRAKSSYLAKNIIEYYYRQIEKVDALDKRVFARK